MLSARANGAIVTALDDGTRALVRVAAVVAAGDDDATRAELQRAAPITPHIWIEELLLQTYLFAGFPRALNGMRSWRRIVGRPADQFAPSPVDARTTGEQVCARVYGPMYDKLRVNIRELHPLLDDWMVEEGYGKVLSRPGLDLGRRELCIVAACAATGQDRQLQSHLHGARNVGVSASSVSDALEEIATLIPAALAERARRLWSKIRHDVH